MKFFVEELNSIKYMVDKPVYKNITDEPKDKLMEQLVEQALKNTWNISNKIMLRLTETQEKNEELNKAIAGSDSLRGKWRQCYWLAACGCFGTWRRGSEYGNKIHGN